MATPPIVEISTGKIQGTILTARHNFGASFFAFRGIPYAKPPLGELRFQPPQEPEPWQGIKLTTEYGHVCPQIENGEVIGDEDCLTLNVFTTNLLPPKPRAVMVWIHGGAHSRGSSALYGPDYLMEQDVILVTINFRLNILGFLSTNDENAYGNVGLKDQIAALKWVQNNIQKFGGDHTRVTIFGYSSGSDSVSLLQLSAQAKGLFHRVICQSGSALNPRYLQRDPVKYARNVAKFFDIKAEDSRAIVEGLQKIDVRKLVAATQNSTATGHKVTLEALPFFPIIEVDHPGAVISKGPYQILEKGEFNKVEFLMGYNSGEASLGYSILGKDKDTKLTDFDEDVTLYYTPSLNNPDKKEEIGHEIKEQYMGKSSAVCMMKFSKYLKQEIFVRGIRKDLDFKRKLNKGYFYIFDFEGSYTAPNPGAAHGEELNYLFYFEDKVAKLNRFDIQTRKRMIRLWTNFAKHGNPTPEEDNLLENIIWPQCDDEENIKCLKIDTQLYDISNPDQEDYEFWNALFEKYAVPPLNTY